MKRSHRLATALAFVPACAPADLVPYELRVWGEAFVEEEIPASEVADGWSIAFTEFVVAIGEVEVVGDEQLALEGWRVYDLHAPSQGAGHAFADVEVAGGADELRYRIGRPTAPPVGGNASPEQVARLRDEGHALYVAGEAWRGDERVEFAWGFAMEYGHVCALGQPEASPSDGAITMTIHADHLLLDDLEHDPAVRFDLLASADGDGDGVVRPDELAAIDLATQSRYQSGSREIPDLWSFVGALAGTMGHVDGEGGCAPEYVPAAYRGRANPFGHAEADAAGFATHCASCHGDGGAGDGPLAGAAWPYPTDLTRAVPGGWADDYLFYRIAEGGAHFPYHSKMPAFASLGDDAIGRIVAHVQSLAHAG